MTTSEETLVNATVAALLLPQSAVANARAGNIGNGTALGVRVAAPALLGIYVATFSDATNFTVAKPGGVVIGAGLVDQNFNIGGLRFVLQAGTVPFAAADAWAFTVISPTSAADKVYAPRDWPAKPEGFPIIHVHWPTEDKESWGPNAPAYDVALTVRIVAKVATLPQKGDAGAGACQAALNMIKRQIEVAVINNYALFRIISEVASIQSRAEVRNEGEGHIGELTMDLVMKFPQTTADFQPVLTDPILEIAIFGDLLDVADPSGTYTPPFNYAVVPAPRTVGPDGRVEVGAIIEL